MQAHALFWWRIFFVVAGLFSLGGGLAGWASGQPVPGETLPPPQYPYILELLFVAVMIFGIGYLMVAKDPLRHRGIVVLGLLSKIAGATFTWLAVADGQIPSSAAFQPWFADVPWAIAFAVFLWQTRDSG